MLRANLTSQIRVTILIAYDAENENLGLIKGKMMSYVFSHVFIPLAILYIFAGKLKLDKKNIISLSFFGIFADFDAIFIHRETFHNVFILFIPILMFFLIRTKNRKEITGIIFFYLLSHLVLDIFNGGISALYPFYDGKFFINAEIRSSYNIDGIIYSLKYGISENFVNSVSKIKGYGIVSSENFGIAVLFLIIGLWSYLRNKFIEEGYNVRNSRK